MSEIPKELKYSSTHEWVRLEEDGTITVGITDYAQDMLGDLVFVELPDLETELRTGEECAVVESVKAASDVFAPVAGEVVEINESLQDMPGTVNSDPYGDGWIFRLKPTDDKELENLLGADEYSENISAEEH
jgi:glycine cleavage system H protein